MNCSCCGKKRRFLESFEELDTDISICVDCSKLLYKYQDYMKEQSFENAEEVLETIKRKKYSKEFETWLESFLARFKDTPENKASEESAPETKKAEKTSVEEG